jgi:UDP-N-acetylmuramate--alanine ligase
MIAPLNQTGLTAVDPSCDSFADKRVHLIGIGGSGMQALAGVLLNCGARVSGSDQQYTYAIEGLRNAGATVSVGQKVENLPPHADVVVYSAAIKSSNPELAAALGRGVPCVQYAEMVGRLMATRQGIAVSGTHGKSTTTGWVAFILKNAQLDPTFIVGADVRQLGGPSGVGRGPHFVAEACEYNRSFHSFRPRIAVVLNIEGDHFDCYNSIQRIVEAFETFASLVPADGLCVVNGDDPLALKAAEASQAPVETFGLENSSDWRAANRQDQSGRYSFDLVYRGQTLGRANLKLLGAHNVSNALAAAAAARGTGVEPEVICHSLSQYTGATRRLTCRGQVKGVTVVDDYAHHPTEVRVTLQAARQHYQPRRLWAVFQPHQHSRCRALLDQFADCFSEADEILLPDIYFARDTQQDTQLISARDLVDRLRQRGKSVDYVPDFDRIVDTLVRNCHPGDLVLTMGPGNIWKVADALVQRL